MDEKNKRAETEKQRFRDGRTYFFVSVWFWAAVIFTDSGLEPLLFAFAILSGVPGLWKMIRFALWRFSQKK